MVSFRHSLLRAGSAAILISTTSFATLAFAQTAPGLPADQPPADQTDAATKDRDIVVTGSRIKGTAANGAVPTITVTRQDIVENGGSTLIDVLKDIPQTGGNGSTFSTATAGALSTDTPVGASAVALRGLGVSSTLTLINGRRAQISAFARGQESFIDASSIPLAAVDRVEILPSGASAIYGADAVAGVINYVLRKDFTGAEFSGSYGDSTAASNESRIDLSGVFGAKLGNQHFMLVVDYYKRNPFYLRDRAVSANSFRPSQQGFYPSFNDLYLQNLDQTESPQNGGCPAANFGMGNLGDYCAVNTNAYVSASDKLETIGGLFTHRWEVNDHLTWYNEALFQHVTSRGTSSPANFSRAPIDPQNPYFPATLKADIVADAGVRSFSAFYGYPIFAYGKIPEPRAVEVTSDSYRFTTGIKGDLGGDWSFDSAFLYGGNDRTQRGLSGLVISKNFYDVNLGNVCTDGSRVRRWDVDLKRPSATYRGATCEAIGKTTLWYNPFGGQTTQAAGIADLIDTTAERHGASRLYAIDASATGTILTLPAGPLKGAFGAEFRRETLDDTPSGIAVATATNPEPILGFSSTSATARRNSWAVYGELYVPVVKHLDLQLAGRYDNYQGFGGDFNPKVSARWQPLDWLAIRGNYATSFRAPSLAQSGAGVLLSSYNVSCVKVPAACNGNAAATGQSLLSEDVGNLNLKAEDSRSFGGGVLLTPTRDISLRVDYWNIDYRNLVGIDEDDFIRRALAGQFAVVGPGLLPSGTPGLEVTNGFVTNAHFQLTNLGYQKTDGIDVSYTHYLPKTSFGRFTLLFDATHYLNFKRRASANSPELQLAGDYLYPDFFATAKVRWRLDKLSASLSGHYTSGYRDDPAPRTLTALGLPTNATYYVSDYVTVDANVTYDITPKTYVQINVRNLLDPTPPRVLGSTANVDLYNHDLIGRYVTLRFTQKF